MSRLPLIILSLVALVLLRGEGCGEPLDSDPGFDLWCGDQLCAWQVDRGSVRRVPTWHRSDFGVELVGDHVVLSQLSLTTSAQSSCFEIRLQADHDDEADLVLQMDFQDDGVTEYSHPLASDNWMPTHYRLTPPTWFERVRFIISKSGSGRVVLAEVKVSKGSDCTDKPMELKNRPDGAPCESADQCGGGRCVKVQQWRADVDGAMVRVCSSCEKDAHCTGGKVCGIQGAAGKRWMYLSCLKPQGQQLGDRCLSDAQCQCGHCCVGVCSECCGSSGCAVGLACKQRDFKQLSEDHELQMLPWQCSPGQGQGGPGKVCLIDSDCISKCCKGSGPLKQCFLDGRRCQSDQDCPLWNACLTTGVAGGACQ